MLPPGCCGGAAALINKPWAASCRPPLPVLSHAYPGLEALEVSGGASFLEVTQAAAELAGLTRLLIYLRSLNGPVVRARGMARPLSALRIDVLRLGHARGLPSPPLYRPPPRERPDPCHSLRLQELARGAYLHSLRELVVRCWRGENPSKYHLPPALAEASSLERLDLSGCSALWLGPADSTLLCALPRLRRLRLPMPDKYAGKQDQLERQAEFESVKEALQGRGVRVEAGMLL